MGRFLASRECLLLPSHLEKAMKRAGVVGGKPGKPVNSFASTLNLNAITKSFNEAEETKHKCSVCKEMEQFPVQDTGPSFRMGSVPDISKLQASSELHMKPDYRPGRRQVMAIGKKNVAEQLCALDCELIRKITWSELMSGGWMKANLKDSLCPNIMKMIRQSNKLSSLVASDVLYTEKLPQRTKVLTFYVELANKLLNMGNLNSSRIIAAALQSEGVYRLKETWETLSGTTKRKFHLLEEFFDASDKSAPYHLFLERRLERDQPLIPFLGTFLTRVVHVSSFQEMSNKNINRNQDRGSNSGLEEERQLQRACLKKSVAESCLSLLSQCQAYDIYKDDDEFFAHTRPFQRRNAVRMKSPPKLKLPDQPEFLDVDRCQPHPNQHSTPEHNDHVVVTSSHSSNSQPLRSPAHCKKLSYGSWTRSPSPANKQNKVGTCSDQTKENLSSKFLKLQSYTDKNSSSKFMTGVQMRPFTTKKKKVLSKSIIGGDILSSKLMTFDKEKTPQAMIHGLENEMYQYKNSTYLYKVQECPVFQTFMLEINPFTQKELYDQSLAIEKRQK